MTLGTILPALLVRTGLLEIAFVPEPPARRKSLSMRRAIEDGRAVILREVPLDR